MDPWQQTNGFLPQQGQPSTLSANDQPRRPLAINDMLNHVPPRDSRYSSSATYQSHFPSPPTQPRLDHEYSYLPGPSYVLTSAFTASHRILPPPPPPGTSEQRWAGELYMSHPPPMVPHYGYAPRTGPVPTDPFPTSQELMTRAAKPAVNWMRKTCAICLEKFEGTDPKSHFPYQCRRCATGDFCAECLTDWFLDACKNESKMPPKCCSIIPLSTVVNILNSSQIELYKAKYEEWATAERIYCPVPTCSTFIPQRLYIKIREEPSTSRNVPSIPSTFNQTQNTQQISPKDERDIKPPVACPTCGVSVCTKCHSFSHIGNCPESDIDPALEEQLKKWKIKRCPKCRAGVRRMYGCSHIECRCGAHFCWECLLPIGQCSGQCDDDGSEVDLNEYHVDPDDLDGNAGFYEGGGPDFGPEPYGHVIDAWGCQHVFSLVIPTVPYNLGRHPLECNRCFRIVRTAAQDEPQPKVDEDIEMTDMAPTWPVNFYGEPAWQCFSGHLVCSRCPKLAPAHRHGDASWLWACDCGISCRACDKVEAMTRHVNDQKHAKEQKEKDDSLAWECRCGTILCGSCKAENA